jgi:hypothetical protein
MRATGSTADDQETDQTPHIIKKAPNPTAERSPFDASGSKKPVLENGHRGRN